MDWLINGTYDNFDNWYTKTTSLRDFQRTYHPETRTYTLATPTIITDYDWEKTPALGVTKEDIDGMFDLDKIKEKEEKTVSMSVVNELSDTERIIVCKNTNDLSPEYILKTVAIMKDKLMSAIGPKKIQKIECSITPLVKTHMVTASKKLRMYGKKLPMVAHFDEFGQRLPDDVGLRFSEGITLKIVDPNDYGEFYLELKATLSFEPIDDYFSPFYNCRSLSEVSL